MDLFSIFEAFKSSAAKIRVLILGIRRAFSYLPQQVEHQNWAALGLIHYPGGHNPGRAEVVFFLFDHFAGGAFPRNKYSWPTASIELRDIFTISGSDSGGDTVIGSQLVVSDNAEDINSWTLP